MMPELSRPDLVIFDWDNTLVDTFPLLHRAYNKMLCHFGHAEWDEKQARAGIRIAAKDCFPAMFGEENFQTAMDVFYTEVEAHHIRELQVIPGAKALLEHLHAHDIPMAVFSNKTDRLLTPEISSLGWDNFFQTCLGASSVEKGKPDPEGVHICARTVKQAHPDPHIWYVGDTENDMKTARAAGVSGIHVVNDPMNTVEEAMQAGADYSFESTQRLLETLLVNEYCAVK